ncbi:post-GPI attachment to proteins factor 2-like [Belonocnema kinseyi]|uniref:post-GPI attachment to proteins factor 2-like n=1 Tax=Belonocnema kinseyi TaxID=2817044 RepID=UPI00143DCDD1|nr:post-GPI attachment to proteins factor 2-like [Belonocnema kinseyi]
MSKRIGSEYLPLVDEEIPRYRIVLNFSKVAWFTVSLPFFAFIFCVIWSVLYNFEQSTFTHCQVYNFLPSISAAIGHYKPQKDVWKAAIAIQAFIRALVFIMYYRFYKEKIYKWAQGMSNMALATYVIENIALVSLSFWSSNENYAIHKLSFITFLVMSIIHMFLSYFLMIKCKNLTKDVSETISLKWKFRSMVLNITSIFLAGYFFYRHNTFCEPLVYSMFALAEYLVVVTNMSFHSTAAWDFVGRRLLISPKGFRII